MKKNAPTQSTPSKRLAVWRWTTSNPAPRASNAFAFSLDPASRIPTAYSLQPSASFTFSAHHPNTSPPQHLPASPKTFFAYCHLQSLAPRALSEISNFKSEIPPLSQAPKEAPDRTHECSLAVRAPAGAPACSHGCSKAQRSKPSATRGQRPSAHPAPAGAMEPHECAQKTTQTAHHPNTSPPQHLPASPKTFFAYCHLRSIAPRASKNAACRLATENQSIRKTTVLPNPNQTIRSPKGGITNVQSTHPGP